MTIKDAEQRTGLGRASIRFYEQEGLISPRRESNGYRDYSEDDVQTLLRIRLLRALDVPIEEIKSVCSGEAELGGVLRGRSAELEKRRDEYARRLSVCRELCENGESFATLDAGRYLSELERGGEPGSSILLTPDEPGTVPHPVRRFLARAVDLALISFVWNAVLSLAFGVNILDQSSAVDFLETLAQLAIMLFLEPLFLHLFGTTPGKWLLGLSLSDDSGARPGYMQGFYRTLGVLRWGYGWSIPVYNLVRLVKSFRACADGRALPWDADSELCYKLRDEKNLRAAAAAAVWCLTIFGSVLCHNAAQLAPNSGALTLSQFAENYNHFSSFTGFDGTPLTPDGQWSRELSDGTVVIDLAPGESGLDFTLAPDGTVAAVRYTVTGRFVTFGTGGGTMQMLALALDGAYCREILGNELADMCSYITQNAGGSFSYETPNVSISCAVTAGDMLDDSDTAVFTLSVR